MKISASGYRWATLAVICAAQFFYLMDAFLLNVSAPAILEEFSSPAVLKGVLSANQIAFASFVFLGGRLGDAFGRNRLFTVGLFGASASALAAAQANTGWGLIGARAAQGVFFACLVPQIMAILVSVFEDDERPRALGIFGTVIGFGGVSGFLAGGLVLEFAGQDSGWRSVFYAVGPALGLLGLLSLRFVPHFPRHPHSAIDVSSSVLLLSAASLIIGPITAQGVIEVSGAALAIALGLTCGWGLYNRQRGRVARGEPSLISARLAASFAFRSGATATFLFFLTNLSFYFTSTMYLSDAFDLSGLPLSLAYLPLGFAFIAGARVGTSHFKRLGLKVISIGLSLQLVALSVLMLVTVLAHAHLSIVIGIFAAFGLAQGIVMPSLIGFLVSLASASESGTASGAQQSAQQFGNAIGVAVAGTIFFTVQATTGSAAAMSAVSVVLALVSANCLLLIYKLSQKTAA